MLDELVRKEWLETNGLGGYASSTTAGINTRRYHGLLVAALRPPVERYVLLSRLEETLVVGGERFDLAANYYPGAVHPEGWRYLREFRAQPFPTFFYSAGGVEVEKRIFMPHGENTVVVEWDIRGGEATLEVRPLIAFRDYHSTTHANGSLDPAVEVGEGVASVRPYAGLPALHLAHTAAGVGTGPGWYYNFEYPIERERGLDDREDLYGPLVLRYQGQRAVLIASLEPHAAGDAEALRRREVDRRTTIACRGPLALAADQYIVRRGQGKTIIAGYHWFSDWGRDTMIALPGLTLVTGQFDVARDILLEFARHVSQGMVPNRFPDAGEEPEYNTVDATLWFFEAIRAYVDYTGDVALVREKLYAVLKSIVHWHLMGTRFGIRADTDRLLASGAPGAQLTWMDAKVGDWVVTPRHGKPVEVQALWYNALRILEGFAVEFDDPDAAEILGGIAARVRESFLAQFWCEQTGCFYDGINGEQRDASIRPNQVIALALHHTMPTAERARAALSVVERELLTPMGLRTLAPSDPSYVGRYEGPPHQRDAAYHQGTVWPWLLGRFVTAYVRAHGDTPEARERGRAFLAPLERELAEGCVGQLAEIFDGDAPHRRRGCCAQAWSVAEVLRALVENGNKPVERSHMEPDRSSRYEDHNHRSMGPDGGVDARPAIEGRRSEEVAHA